MEILRASCGQVSGNSETAKQRSTLWTVGKRRDVPRSGRTFSGSIIAGWGLFNFVEGVIDHHILGIHHVVELYGLSIYDYLFLASGVLFMLIGLGLIKAGERDVLSKRVPSAYR